MNSAKVVFVTHARINSLLDAVYMHAYIASPFGTAPAPAPAPAPLRSGAMPNATEKTAPREEQGERELFFGLHIFPIMGGSAQEPKTKRQKKEHVRRVQHIGVQGPYRKSRWSHICNTRVFASC